MAVASTLTRPAPAGTAYLKGTTMRLRAALTSTLIIPAMILAACGTADSEATDSDQSTAQAETSTGDQENQAGDNESGADATTPDGSAAPAEPASTAVADPVDRDQLPQASGDFGDKPTITVPDNDPPDSLQRVVLSEGDGPESAAGDTIIVDYLGQVWGGDVFDNSYDRGSPFVVQVGGPQRQVVTGWDVGLQGVAAGSRVLLSFPPRDGYGAEGSPPAIGGTDTLIFVVDVINVYSADSSGDADATAQDIPDGWPTVGGDLGGTPTVSVPATLPEPSQEGTLVIAQGDGEPVQPGVILMQYVATTWDGSLTAQSWPDPTGADPNAGIGPQQLQVAPSAQFSGLIGVPIGSRVLVRTPANDDIGSPAIARVFDLLAQTDVVTD